MASIPSKDRVQLAAQIKTLPWFTFGLDRRKCRPKEAGWTYKDALAVQDFLSLLEPYGTRWVVIEDMEYQLMGRDLTLIQRRSTKE